VTSVAEGLEPRIRADSIRQVHPPAAIAREAVDCGVPAGTRLLSPDVPASRAAAASSDRDPRPPARPVSWDLSWTDRPPRWLRWCLSVRLERPHAAPRWADVRVTPAHHAAPALGSCRAGVAVRPERTATRVRTVCKAITFTKAWTALPSEPWQRRVGTRNRLDARPGTCRSL